MKMRCQIFISYRRADSGYTAQHLCKEIAGKFHRRRVFFDIDDIKPGVDFRDTIVEKISECDVMLVMMSKEWINVSQVGRRRLDDPDDTVRLEVETALERNIPMIPVLLDSASMPREAELPPKMKSLARKNAVSVRSGQDYENDVARLIDGIKIHLKPARLNVASLIKNFPRSPATRNALAATISLYTVGLALRFIPIPIAPALVALIPFVVIWLRPSEKWYVRLLKNIRDSTVIGTVIYVGFFLGFPYLADSFLVTQPWTNYLFLLVVNALLTTVYTLIHLTAK